MRQIEQGVYIFSRASIKQYLLVEDTRATLIDTGLSIFSALFLKELKNTVNGKRLDTILITHADGDHTGTAGRIRKTFHGKIASSAPEAEAIRSGQMSRELEPQNFLFKLVVNAFLPLFNTPPTQVDELLVPGQTLPILGGLQVLDSSGHTPGHLSFYQPELRILFAGDSIVERNHAPSPAYGMNCWDEKLAKKSFERQMALNPVHLCCGHSYFRLI